MVEKIQKLLSDVLIYFVDFCIVTLLMWLLLFLSYVRSFSYLIFFKFNFLPYFMLPYPSFFNLNFYIENFFHIFYDDKARCLAGFPYMSEALKMW